MLFPLAVLPPVQLALSTVTELPDLPPAIPQLPISNPSPSSTANRICAPPPPNPAQPSMPPQDTSSHPTPARTRASAPQAVAQSSPTVVPAAVPGCRADGRESPERSSTTEAPGTQDTTCAPAPAIPAQVSILPQDTPLHPTPARTCASAPVGCSPARASNTPARHQAIDPPMTLGIAHPAQNPFLKYQPPIPSTPYASSGPHLGASPLPPNNVPSGLYLR
jgi:hypothetical protein